MFLVFSPVRAKEAALDPPYPLQRALLSTTRIKYKYCDLYVWRHLERNIYSYIITRVGTRLNRRITPHFPPALSIIQMSADNEKMN